MSRIEASEIDDTYARFWTSRPAKGIYVLVFFSLLTHELRILYGILLVFLFEMILAALKWWGYIASDPELWRAIEYMSTWMQRIVGQGKEIVSSEEKFGKRAVLGTALMGAGVGHGGARMAIGAKNKTVRNEFISGIDEQLETYRKRFMGEKGE